MKEAAKFEIGEIVEVYAYGNDKLYRNPRLVIISKIDREWGTWVYEDIEGVAYFEHHLRKGKENES